MPQRELPTDAPVSAALNHVVLRNAHVEKCVDFYGKLLGMKVHAGDGKFAAALSHDGEHHRLLLMGVVGERPDPSGPGVEHIAFKTGSMGELLGNYVRVKKLGIEPFMVVHHGGTLSAYYLDPDGVQIEIFIDTFPTDVSIEYINTPEFQENPIGSPIDLDDLVARFEAGEPLPQLYARPEPQEGDLESLIEKVQAARGGALR
jgi:catechol 2,3-dioxygenase-like lactoylglutathione lyase family enzyme